MFGRFTRTFANVVPPSVRTNWLTPTFCDDTEEVAPPEQTLDDLAKEIEKAEKEGSALAHTPAKYKEFSGSFMSGMVQTFDGARLIVQKQLNLNTVVSHFYWVGSQAMNNQPVYKYTCILPFSDDKVLNIGTDMDMNLEGEAKVQLDDSLSLKSGFAFGQQGNNYTVDLDYNDASSTAQLWYTQDEQQGGSIYGFGFMQALLKEFALGASMTYIPSQKTTTTSFAGLFDDETNKIALQYGGGVSHLLYYNHYDHSSLSAFGISLSLYIMASVVKKLCYIDAFLLVFIV